MHLKGENWLISIGAGKWQQDGIRKALDMGLKVLAIDGDPQAPGLKIASRSVVMNIKDSESICRLLAKLEISMAGAISFCSEAGMLTAAKVRERFALPGPDTTLTANLTNKLKQRQAWTKAGVPGPIWKAIESEEEGTDYLEQIKLPVIVKPVDSAGSRGVTKIERVDEFMPAIRKAFEFSDSKIVLIESFLPGTEYTVETFSVEGECHVLAITGKRKIASSRGTVAMELATPDLSGENRNLLGDTVKKALAALGYEDGPGHSEVMLDEQGSIGMIESAGRGGGFMVFQALVPWASGFDITEACIDQAIGNRVEVAAIENTAVVLRFFPSRAGTVTKIDGFDRLKAIGDRIQAEPFVSIGQKISDAQSDGDRLGYLLTRGSSVAEAQNLADAAERMVYFGIQE